MRKIVAALMGTVSGLVLLFSYHTSTNGQAATAAAATDTGESQSSGTTPNADAGSSTTGSASGATPQDSSSSSSTDSSASSSSAAPTAASGTYTGDAVQTRYGAVQVEITVENGALTSSNAIQYPNRDRHDQQINSYAVPVLNAEAVEAQSADIDSVSGATFTSLAYAQSLQSAIDQAFQ
ncbi:FMN-binding protein [Tessaracoccus sp. G1721]